MTLIPAYGRDYKSRAAAVAHFQAGKDFRIADMIGGHSSQLINVADLRAMGARKVFIRYLRLTRITAVEF